MNEIQLRIKNGEKESTFSCPYGTEADSLLPQFGPLPSPLAAVKINNEILPLSTRLEINALIEPVLLDSSEGSAIYRRSLAFLLAAAARQLFPEWKLYIGHSLGRAYYYTFDELDSENEFQPPGEKEIQKLAEEMQRMAGQDLPIIFKNVAYSDALDLFERNHQDDTALLLAGRNESMVLINQCGPFMDLYTAPLVSRTGLLRCFDLMPYKEGFLLRFPRTGGDSIEPFVDSPKIFEVYREYKKWGRIIGVRAVGHLNHVASDKNVREYIRIAEAFQQKKLDEIADRIYEKVDSVKAILIAGPSSSGKTTTAKRLCIALKVLGIEPIVIGLDNYYVGTDKTPLDEDGKPDFECLEALDVPCLNEHLVQLFEGREVALPDFDFKAGQRKAGGGKTIRMEKRSMLVIEGIHGLNDALTPQINRETKFKLYVSALTQLNLDDHNRIPTSDNRLLRRMVRDHQFRYASAARTFGMWPSVQKGERKHIFPFQNEADVAFNSALDYELAVLKFYAEPLLNSVKPDMKEYAEAVRLHSFLKNFAPIPPQYVPKQSILREFIGESEFKY